MYVYQYKVKYHIKDMEKCSFSSYNFVETFIRFVEYKCTYLKTYIHTHYNILKKTVKEAIKFNSPFSLYTHTLRLNFQIHFQKGFKMLWF